jgi:transcriptional regulator with XRE-family HTH domain
MTPASVRARRIELHMSQGDVAKAIHCSRVAITRFEAKDLRLSQDILDRIGELLGLDYEERKRRRLRTAAAMITHAVVLERQRAS